MPRRRRFWRISMHRFSEETGAPLNRASRTWSRTSAGRPPRVMRTSRVKWPASKLDVSSADGPCSERTAAIPPPAAMTISTWLPLLRICSAPGVSRGRQLVEPERNRNRASARGRQHLLDRVEALRRDRRERRALRAVRQIVGAVRDAHVGSGDGKFLLGAQLEIAPQILHADRRHLGRGGERPARRHADHAALFRNPRRGQRRREFLPRLVRVCDHRFRAQRHGARFDHMAAGVIPPHEIDDDAARFERDRQRCAHLQPFFNFGEIEFHRVPSAPRGRRECPCPAPSRAARGCAGK